MMDYTFSAKEAEAAHKEWGCNCGPAALAFALQVNLEAVRHKIPGFETKHYTSPSMMADALAEIGRAYERIPVPGGEVYAPMFAPKPALVRVQWTGPWTKPGSNPRWAYRQTHWIACWRAGASRLVFDVNGGIRPFTSWQAEIVPALTALYNRADGGWFPTHIWKLK